MGWSAAGGFNSVGLFEISKPAEQGNGTVGTIHNVLALEQIAAELSFFS